MLVQRKKCAEDAENILWTSRDGVHLNQKKELANNTVYPYGSIYAQFLSTLMVLK